EQRAAAIVVGETIIEDEGVLAVHEVVVRAHGRLGGHELAHRRGERVAAHERALGCGRSRDVVQKAVGERGLARPLRSGHQESNCLPLDVANQRHLLFS
ncbi:MAG TPA: hypothetical protein VKE69_05040, partial [Planctomycetota bacterium]|nr:hypothetical protein [Planctomycetota bacterium]